MIRPSFLDSEFLGYPINVGDDNPLNEGLLAFYTLDELSGDRIDCGPNSLDCDASGGAGSTNEGILNNAATFQGTFARLASRVSGGIIDDVINQSFTIAGWVNLDPAITNSGTVFGITQGNMNDDALVNVFYENTGDGFVLFLNDGAGGTFVGMTFPGGSPKNAWIFLALTYDAVTNVYTLQANDNHTGTSGVFGPLSAPAGQRLLMGSTFDTGVIVLLGDVDNVVYYADRVLPPSGIDYYFKGGGLINSVVCAYFFEQDAIGKDEGFNDVTLIGSGGFGPVSGIKDGAIGFDGTGGAASNPSTDLDNLRENSFSLTIWTYIDSAHTGSANLLSILSGFSEGDLLVTLTLFADTTFIAADIYSNGGVNKDTLIQQIGGTIPRDTWFSIQATYDESTGVFRVRLNDQAFSQLTVANPTNVSPGLRITVGDLFGAAFFLNGRVDEATVYSEALSDVMLNTRYMGGLVTRPYNPGQPPCAISQPQTLQDGSGNVLRDGSGNILQG